MTIRILTLIASFFATGFLAADEYRSHRPTRPLPEPFRGELVSTPARFVDPARGDDSQPGSAQQPWQTLAHALRQLQPGDTLYLRAGTYYERPYLSRSGTADAPITISAYPGETPVIDGGLREFFESPNDAWQPYPDGAPGEFVSTRVYLDADRRHVPQQFLPAAWEPMWGLESERPLALGQFGDSMLPLHGYRHAIDLRAANEFWIDDKRDREQGVYCGPGLWFNRDTGRIHIRLAHHSLPGLGIRAYRGETDPRQLPLVVALGFGEEVLRITGIRHVRLQGIVLRGATGSPLIHIYGSENVELDHLTLYGGFPALLVNATKNLRVTHTACRGLAAPWSGRAHMKYRGTASYQIVLQNSQPYNENIEFSWCEFTDDHDFAFLRFARNLQFHHNLVDNFNDDGLECGPKLRWHTLHIYQNRIGACLTTFTQHEIDKDESPPDHDPGSGVYVYRNIFDPRDGVHYSLPRTPDPSGEFLHAEGALASDHGSPVWAVMRFYHNTFLRATPAYRDNFLFGLAVGGMRRTERDVFNNLFVQLDRLPGTKFVAASEDAQLREGGNLLWSPNDDPTTPDPFARFRAASLFLQSKRQYEPGWTTDDAVGDPRFVSLPEDCSQPADLRLQSGSAAIGRGLPLPVEWPDPMRVEQPAGTKRPDAGALPLGAQAWRVGVDARWTVFGERAALAQ